MAAIPPKRWTSNFDSDGVQAFLHHDRPGAGPALPELGGVESCGTREERASPQFFQFAPHCRQTLMPSFSPVLFQDAAFPFVDEIPRTL
jgi:hypothetical protein